MQLNVQQEFLGARVDARLLIQPDNFVEVPHDEEDPDTDGAHAASALPGHVPVWRERGDRRWRRDSPVLDGVPKSEEAEQSEPARPRLHDHQMSNIE